MTASAPKFRRWAGHARAQWQLLRETARVIGPSARLFTSIEAHTYAYSVAANFLLAALPFLVLLLWIAHHLLPSLTTQQAVIAQLAANYLPAGQQRLIGDATRLAGHHSAQFFSLVMLAISSSGIFLPLEVALNSIWGFKRNRGYLGNAAVALALVVACGIIAYASILCASLATALVGFVFPASWTWIISAFTDLFIALFSLPAAILVFFVIYWRLPNGKVSPAQVFPAALYTGVLAEGLKILFPYFVQWVDFTAVYASLAVAVTLLVWGYCGALLLLFGASLSARGVARLPRLRIRAHGHHVATTATALPTPPAG